MPVSLSGRCLWTTSAAPVVCVIVEAMDSTPEPQPPVVPGYVLTLPLGTGAQGTVWRATRVADRADRAIKVVASCGADALAGSVDNPDMVRVHEVLTLGDGHVAVVMDLMDGGSLRGLVDARGVLTSGETVSLLVPLAQALGRLHALGLVHGDVSPDNVLLDADGRPRLIDLGAAHGRGLGAREVWGTGGFVAPEVAVGGADPTPRLRCVCRGGPGVVRPHRARTAVGRSTVRSRPKGGRGERATPTSPGPCRRSRPGGAP
jgi:serine/threonine protein kinase